MTVRDTLRGVATPKRGMTSIAAPVARVPWTQDA